VKFEQVDLDKSGEISKQEFKTIKKSNNLVYTEPLWAFYGILALVAGLLIISNFLQRKKNNE
jgi:general stress protein CsbA